MRLYAQLSFDRKRNSAQFILLDQQFRFQSQRTKPELNSVSYNHPIRVVAPSSATELHFLSRNSMHNVRCCNEQSISFLGCSAYGKNCRYTLLELFPTLYVTLWGNPASKSYFMGQPFQPSDIRTEFLCARRLCYGSLALYIFAYHCAQNTSLFPLYRI